MTLNQTYSRGQWESPVSLAEPRTACWWLHWGMNTSLWNFIIMFEKYLKLENTFSWWGLNEKMICVCLPNPGQAERFQTFTATVCLFHLKWLWRVLGWTPRCAAASHGGATDQFGRGCVVKNPHVIGGRRERQMVNLTILSGLYSKWRGDHW